MVAATRPWLAFRFDCPPPFESFLTDFVGSWVRQRYQDGTLRRWFFLWHSEGGFHLRLRVQPTRSADELRSSLRGFVEEHKLPLGAQEQTYDRDTLGFGETMESVGSELAHWTTSQLAIQILDEERKHSGIGRRWAITAGVAYALAARTFTAQQLRQAIVDWRAFAGGATRQMGFELRQSANALHSTRIQALCALVPRVASQLAADDATRRATWLLRRLYARGAHGRFVAIHALHFFCNEMGLTLAAEYSMVSTLLEYLERPSALENEHITAKRIGGTDR